MNHEKLMQRCINLGEKALGKTYPNPNVGSLLFYDGKIIYVMGNKTYVMGNKTYINDLS